MKLLVIPFLLQLIKYFFLYSSLENMHLDAQQQAYRSERMQAVCSYKQLHETKTAHFMETGNGDRDHEHIHTSLTSAFTASLSSVFSFTAFHCLLLQSLVCLCQWTDSLAETYAKKKEIKIHLRAAIECCVLSTCIGEDV